MAKPEIANNNTATPHGDAEGNGSQDNSSSRSIAALSQSLCTGCGACEQLCPQHAIVIVEDDFGFLRANVDKSLCNGCGLCARRCVRMNPSFTNWEKPDCYAGMADDELRSISSSGGAFSIVATHILSQGGYVCGAALTDDNLSVHHILVNQAEDLPKLRGSKYMQSLCGGAFPKIGQLLESGFQVLFTGMPCQVGGLKGFLGKDYPNLTCIDIFCHGVPSAKIFQKYVQDELGGRAIRRLAFKDKEPWGWHAGIKAWFEDDSHYFRVLEQDPFFHPYVENLFNNSACATCPVSRLPRQGDWSIGDFWGISKFNPTLNDGKGTSAILINNEKGRKLAETLRGDFQTFAEVPLAIACAGNGCISHPYPNHKNRQLFFTNFNELKFGALQKGCLKNRFYEQELLKLREILPDEDMEYYYLARLAAQKAGGRAIVTWIRSGKFESLLKNHFGLEVAFGVSQRKEALLPGKIEPFEKLSNQSDKYFLVSIDRAYDEALAHQLESLGYCTSTDVIFRKIKPIVLENLDLAKGNYYDDYGNSIEGYNIIVRKVILRGYNNHIMLGPGVNSGKLLEFDLCANATVQIGANVQFTGPSRFESNSWGTSNLKIGDNCKFYAGALFRFWPPGSAVIGADCTSSSAFCLRANHGKKVIIGKDCMFSYDNELSAGDGHAIFDVKSGKCANINLTSPGDPANLLVVGDHVWVGKQAFIMSGANIGEGSIIGSRAVVKKTFANNVAIIGNPAKAVKEDVAWSRDGMSENIASCGKYAHLTCRANGPLAGKRVLVVGGTRFMGKHLVRRLLELGNDVTIATRGVTPDDFGLNIQRIKVDITNVDSARMKLGGKSYDVVFDDLAYSARNVNNLLTNVDCGKYVQLSSIMVYRSRRPGLCENMFKADQYTCDLNAAPYYDEGKRQAEAIACKKFSHIPSVFVRIPYVTKTDRLYFYCKNTINQVLMNIKNVEYGMCFVQDSDVGDFLPWIAAQDYNGSMNFASCGMVTLRQILTYIESKLNIKSLVSDDKGEKSPFNEETFSLDMTKAQSLGWSVQKLDNWFWKLMDEYISRARREKK